MPGQQVASRVNNERVKTLKEKIALLSAASLLADDVADCVRAVAPDRSASVRFFLYEKNAPD